MSTSPELQQRAADPSTPAQELADLAAAHPELQATIARNPSTYEGLLDWLRQYGDADVQAALDARASEAVAVTPPPPPPAVAGPPAPPVVPAAGYTTPAYGAAPAPGAAPAYGAPAYGAAPGYGARPATFVEPSRSIPITYLNHDLRYTLALVAVGVAGLLQAVILPLALPAVANAVYSGRDYQAAGTAYAIISFLLTVLPWLLLGAAVFVLPSLRKNTMLALGFVAGPVLIQVLSMILGVAAYAGGLPYIGVTILSFFSFLFPAAAIAAWLAARMRPGIAFALLPISLLSIGASSFSSVLGLGGFYSGYGASPITIILGILSIGVLVGIAWLARLIAARQATAPTPAERAAQFEAQQHAARVAHLQQWQAAAAHAATYGGPAPAAPGFPTAPPTTAPGSAPFVPPMTPPSAPPVQPPS